MNYNISQRISRNQIALMAAAIFAALAVTPTPCLSQNPQLQERVAEVKQAAAMNKQSLAHYTWQEQQTVSVKGDVKDTKVYQVQMGPDGQQQKNEISDEKAQSGGHEGHLKKHVVEKKKEEYQQYGQQIGALAKQYTTPDPDRLMEAKQRGDISLQPGAGTVSLVIKNYVKPGDSVTMTTDQQTHAPLSVQVSSYLDDPKDAVTIAAQYAKLPDGTNHVASTQIDGVSKKLTVNTQNSNYQKL